MSIERVLYLGTVVSNGGDAAIQRAQSAVLGEAFGRPAEGLHDSSPPVARRAFPDAHVLPQTFAVVNRPGGMRLDQRVARRLNKERVRLAGRLWQTRGRPLARTVLTRGEAAQLASIAGADLVAYTGGTSLIEKYSVHGKLYDVDLALSMGRPVVLMPQSLGPFHRPVNQEAVRRTLRRVTAVFLRDERSLRFLEEIGARTDHVHVVPDIVFALQDEESAERLAGGRLPERGARVAVSVRDCSLFFDGDEEQRRSQDGLLRDALAGLVTHLVRERGARVTFLSTCQGVPEYWTDDADVADSVVARLAPEVRDRVEVDRAFHDTDDLLRRFADVDVVVATRLHAAILALDAGTPVLPIAYEFKTEEVMSQLGMAEHVVTIADATPERLRDALERFVADLPALRPLLAERVRVMGREARRTGALVRAALGDGDEP
jgi:colanic acid/amylovoran biosynthesis protein